MSSQSQEAPASTVSVTERRVRPGEWHETIAELRREGFAFFDWLSAVDETDAEEGGTGRAVTGRGGTGRTRSGAAETTAQSDGEGDDAPTGPGIEVVCHLMDLRKPLRRVLVHTRVPEGGSLASVTDLFAGAAWHERETHEMFGVGFDGFEDGTGEGLRPLLLPDGFEGTPLRKSFQLASRASKPWPGAKDPGEGEGSTTKRAPSRRRLLPPGVPPATWGPRGD